MWSGVVLVVPCAWGLSSRGASINVATGLYSAIAKEWPTTVTFPLDGDDGLIAAVGPEDVWASDRALGVVQGQAIVATGNKAMLGISSVVPSFDRSGDSYEISFDVPDAAAPLKLRRVTTEKATDHQSHRDVDPRRSLQA